MSDPHEPAVRDERFTVAEGKAPFNFNAEGRYTGNCWGFPCHCSCAGLAPKHGRDGWKCRQTGDRAASGGLDSMVSAALARKQGFSLLALTIDYNQRHRREIEAASRIARELGVKRHVVLPLDLSRFGGSALTNDTIAVPKEGASARISR